MHSIAAHEAPIENLWGVKTVYGAAEPERPRLDPVRALRGLEHVALAGLAAFAIWRLAR